MFSAKNFFECLTGENVLKKVPIFPTCGWGKLALFYENFPQSDTRKKICVIPDRTLRQTSSIHQYLLNDEQLLNLT